MKNLYRLTDQLGTRVFCHLWASNETEAVTLAWQNGYKRAFVATFVREGN